MIAKWALYAAFMSMAFISCKKENQPGLQSRLDSGESISELLESYPVDSFYSKSYLGGYIFQLNEDGTGMIVSTTDLSNYANWGCSGTTIDGANATGIGAGMSNTDSIVSQCSEETCAAALCWKYGTNGNSDWFLPSQDELFYVYQRVHARGVGGFSDNFYWSSSESAYASNSAQRVLFTDGAIGASTKSNPHYVRAVRNF